MINEKQLGIIKLCKSAVKGTKEVMPNCFSIDECKDIVISHNLYNIVYFGLKNSELPIPSYIEQGFYNNVYQLSLFDKEYKSISKAFDDNNIYYHPIKGIKTRYRYPNINMRVMSDIDILIDKKEYKKIRKIMNRLGFVETGESDHEYIFKKDLVSVELHKSIIPTYHQNLINSLKLYNDLLYENDFAYAFIHFTKHFMDGGFGVSHLVELEALRDNSLDSVFTNTEFKDFYVNIINTLDSWFGDNKFDDVTSFITRQVFIFGLFGNEKRQDISIDLRNKKNNTFYNFLRRIFPKAYWMKTKYHFVMKHPFLLPIAYFWRFIEYPFKKNNHQKDKITNEEIEAYLNDLNFVGLDKFIK